MLGRISIAFDSMDIRQLKTLLAIAEFGTFARAADAVHLTPSAVSQQMHSLEVEVGCDLFNRTTRPPSLNMQGLHMLHAARVLVDTAAEAIESVNGNTVTGTFTIGSVRTAGFGLLPLAIASLMSTFPELNVRLRIGMSDDLMVDLAARRLDAALVVEHARIPPRIRWNPYVREPLRIISKHCVKNDDWLEVLTTNPYVCLSTNTPLVHLIDAEIARFGVELTPRIEVDSVSSVVACVEAGLGVAVVPAIATESSNSIHSVAFGDPPVFRQIGLAQRFNNPRADIVKKLHSIIAGLSGEHGLTKYSTPGCSDSME